MKKYTVSEDKEIVLDGKKYLLEKGDKIVINEMRETTVSKDLYGKPINFQAYELTPEEEQELKETGPIEKSSKDVGETKKEMWQKLNELREIYTNDPIVQDLEKQISDAISIFKRRKKRVSPQQTTSSWMQDTVEKKMKENAKRNIAKLNYELLKYLLKKENTLA